MSANLKILLLEAAERIEANADALKECHTLRGQWQLTTPEDVAAFRDFHEDKALATALRAEAAGMRIHNDLPALLRRQSA